MEKKILDDIDRSLVSHRYSTRTEFIRDAIRSKLTQQEKEDALRRIDALFGKGKAKNNISEEEAGEMVFRRIARNLGVELK
jgi:Arc/MetJ-type ribon-helix-helix transcriptional regulator